MQESPGSMFIHTSRTYYSICSLAVFILFYHLLKLLLELREEEEVREEPPAVELLRVLLPELLRTLLLLRVLLF